jgi:3-hydroxy acid dehydrogenase / malonic semialdehyde reductase
MPSKVEEHSMTNASRLGPGAVALVTGASSGIGLAVALALAREGCKVIMAARRADRLARLAREIGPLAIPVVLDVRDAKAVEDLLAQLPPELRKVDILINNAGHDIGGRRRFDTGSADTWTDIIETNLQGLVRVTRALLPGMLERGKGDIVNLGSSSGVRAAADRAAYGASKAAVHMFSQNLRIELAGTGVRLTEILPGLTRTEFAEVRLRGNATEAQAFYDNAGTAINPEDVAQSVLFALRQPPHVTVAELVLLPSTAR